LTHPVKKQLLHRYRLRLVVHDGYRLHYIAPSGFSWFSSFLHHANDYRINISNNRIIIIKKINNLPASKSKLNLFANLPYTNKEITRIVNKIITPIILS